MTDERNKYAINPEDALPDLGPYDPGTRRPDFVDTIKKRLYDWGCHWVRLHPDEPLSTRHIADKTEIDYTSVTAAISQLRDDGKVIYHPFKQEWYNPKIGKMSTRLAHRIQFVPGVDAFVANTPEAVRILHDKVFAEVAMKEHRAAAKNARDSRNHALSALHELMGVGLLPLPEEKDHAKRREFTNQYQEYLNAKSNKDYNERNPEGPYVDEGYPEVE